MSNRRIHQVISRNRSIPREKRKQYHHVILLRIKGKELPDLLIIADNELYALGINSWELVPVNARRNWQEQPD